jgi:hypothetical protein
MPHDLNGIYMAGIDQETYQKLLEIAKRDNISVSEAMSRVMNKGLTQANLKESSKEKKLLVEG